VGTEQQIGAKPVGMVGKLAGRLMNMVHKGQYHKIIARIKKRTEIPVNGILDIGCGGGIAVKSFASQFPEAILYGIDHAAEMVELSAKTNRQAVRQGRVKLLQNSIERVEITDNSIDIATAFDTINFWPDYDLAMAEIRRVLTAPGKFYIINGYPEPGTKWYEFVKFKDQGEYEAILNEHGFKMNDVQIEGHTIVIEAVLEDKLTVVF
jgi:ubiquinone/menaquinone biosynthesis C-methylase UbiE